MIGGFIGHPIGWTDDLSRVIVDVVGSSAGSSAALGVGSSTASTVGSSSGAATVTGVGAGVIDTQGQSSGAATVSGVALAYFSARGEASGSAVATGISIVLPITSREVLEDPVDCVLAGQQMEFRKGRATRFGVRHAFNE